MRDITSQVQRLWIMDVQLTQLHTSTTTLQPRGIISMTLFNFRYGLKP